eukprot:5738-Heterococcus_DN1.PRE.3
MVCMSASHHLLATSSGSDAMDIASRNDNVDSNHVCASSNTDARAAFTTRVTAQQRTHVRCIETQ